MTVFLFMEDFDDEELPEYDRLEQLREAVRDYNAQYNGDHNPDKSLSKYLSWKREKYKPDM